MSEQQTSSTAADQLTIAQAINRLAAAQEQTAQAQLRLADAVETALPLLAAMAETWADDALDVADVDPRTYLDGTSLDD